MSNNSIEKKKKSIKRKVGRPIEKENRTKVGLSLKGDSADLLSALAHITGKSKSRVIEEAILLFKDKEEIIRKRIEKIETSSDNVFLDLNEIIEERLKIEKEKRNENKK